MQRLLHQRCETTILVPRASAATPLLHCIPWDSLYPVLLPDTTFRTCCGRERSRQPP